MKSVDPLTLLQPAAPTPGEVPQKGATDPAAGFSAILAEANQQDAASVTPQSKTSPEQPAALQQPENASDVPAVTAANEQTTAVGPKAKSGKAGQPSPAIALPQQARSIHDSITRSTRGLSPRGERPAASALRSPAPALSEQGAVTTTEPDGATSQVAADDPFALALGAEDPNDAAGDPAALQAVLGQVASVITGIVVPPAQAAQLAPRQVASEGTRIGSGNAEPALGAQRASATAGREGPVASPTTPRADAPPVGAAPVPAGARVSPAVAAFSDALAGAPEAGASSPTPPGPPAQFETQVGSAGSAPQQSRFVANDRQHAQHSYGANTPATAQPRGAPHAREAGLPEGSASMTPNGAPWLPGAGAARTAEAQPSLNGQPIAERTQPAASIVQGQPFAGPAQPMATVAQGQPSAGAAQPMATVAQGQPFTGSALPTESSARAPFAAAAMKGRGPASASATAVDAVQTAGDPAAPASTGAVGDAAALLPLGAPGAAPEGAQATPPGPQGSAKPNTVAPGAPRSGRADLPAVPPRTLPFAGTSDATASAEPARAQEAPRATHERARDGRGEPQRQFTGVVPGPVGSPEGARNGQPSPALTSRGGAAAPTTPNLSTSGMPATPNQGNARASATPNASNVGVSATPNLSTAGAPATLDPNASLLPAGATASGADASPTSASTSRPVPLAQGAVALPKNELRPAVGAPAKAGFAAPAGGVRAPDSPVAQVSGVVADATLANASAPAVPAQRAVPQEQQPGVAPSPRTTAVDPMAVAAPIPATQAALPSALSVSATTQGVANSGRPALQAGKPNEPTDDRIHGFTRGALFGSAISAYAERAHGDTNHDSPARGKHSDDPANDERSSKAEPVFTLDRPLPNDPQLLAVQLPAPPPDAPPMPQPVAAPVPVPAPTPPVNVPEVVFAARPPGGQPEAASISIHHPDLGAIQLEVHRERGRVEVHAVIESVHAEAVLRANESGIRQGVQQSGMTFSALRVRVRGEEPQTARPAQARRRRADEREK